MLDIDKKRYRIFHVRGEDLSVGTKYRKGTFVCRLYRKVENPQVML